jgi:hypothetical protein
MLFCASCRAAEIARIRGDFSPCDFRDARRVKEAAGCGSFVRRLPRQGSSSSRLVENPQRQKTLVIQVIFATLIEDPHEIVQGGFRIGKDPVKLSQ